MTVPEWVKQAATRDRKKLPVSLAAVRLEIASGKPTAHSIQAASEYAQQDPDAGIGGRPVSVWLAAASLKAVPQVRRSGGHDDWVIEATQDPQLPAVMANLNATTRPTALREIGEQFETIDDRLHAELLTAIEIALAAVLRKSGLRVIACIGDPAILDQIRAPLPITDVPGKAIELMGGASFTAAVGPEIDRAITAAVQSLSSEVRRVVERYFQRIQEAVSDLLGADTSDLSVAEAVTEAVEEAERRFVEVVDQRVKPGVEEPEGRQTSGAVYAGIATAVLSRLRGTDDATGSVGARVLIRGANRADPGALTPTLARIVEGLQARPEALVPVQVWAHGYYGRGETDFPPHRRLDGAVVGTTRWRNQRLQPLVATSADGTPVTTAPFRGEWFPGDHVGCTCAYRTELTFTI